MLQYDEEGLRIYTHSRFEIAFSLVPQKLTQRDIVGKGASLDSLTAYLHASVADTDKLTNAHCEVIRLLLHPFCIIVRSLVEGTEFISRDLRKLAFKWPSCGAGHFLA